MSFAAIKIRGARQHNLKNLDLDIPLGEMVVVTGVSGAGKSSLAFDTLYAEGQRRYVETFSAYARQFLDRMDKPAVDAIEDIPPAIAIEQSNTVRTSRSTVGTMTEINDYLKLLFARLAHLYCSGCGQKVVTDSPQSVAEYLYEHWPAEQRLMVCLPISVPEKLSDEEVLQLLNQQGYTRMHSRSGQHVEVVQDRLKLTADNRSRLLEALEAAMHYGKGQVRVYPLDAQQTVGSVTKFSSHYHCPACDIYYSPPTASHFSFNSPIGACDTCRGFGRVIGVDWGLVIPDERKSLQDGAIKPIQTPGYAEVQQDLVKFAKRKGVPINKPWAELSRAQRDWVIEGEGGWDEGVWYGLEEFFAWLESKAYKMHIRVLLSKYRAYSPCQSCQGARLKSDALWWRVGSLAAAEEALGDQPRFIPTGASLTSKKFAHLPGLNITDVMRLPLSRALAFFQQLDIADSQASPSAVDEASTLLLTEIRARLNYLCEVGLGYLTLDRQSRTLSGGEVQRINLTTALGSSLVNTLFILDEPSTGLHPRDIDRLVTVLHRLRDAGNSLLIVEHDPQVILAADRILDLGPGPGKQGGNIEFFGTPKALLQRRSNITARYLQGIDRVVTPSTQTETSLPALPASPDYSLHIQGACENNLKNIDVRIPLGQLVALTGVSGSGKSTLMRQVLYPALLKHLGEATEAPGEHQAIIGMEHIHKVVMVDQSPIGKTTRSTPATYVGAYDAIRQCFINTPLAKERGYKPGIFSFNSGNGRCSTCQGNGFEHVEMQFLSDVYLRCPDCNGKRFGEEVLEVKLLRAGDAHSIADVLAMTVTEALEFFSDEENVMQRLQPLADVGLDYVQLGQAVPTLSGGEAQRLKLAGHLAEAFSVRGKKSVAPKDQPSILFLFDEPTTGLHFADIATLMRAFRQLQQAGHSLLIIEHNLDVIGGADWVIDIGPEGGDAGGEVLAEGTPEALIKNSKGYTAKALKQYQKSLKQGAPLATLNKKPTQAKAVKKVISVHNAREHNLKNIDVTIPRDTLTVITGVSGSGKSTLAFDLVFGEGQRRYLESLNAYARQFVQPAARPDVDAIYGIPPAVAIEQRTSRGGRKSTVATLTEIYHYLRLLFVKLGTQHCPQCDLAIEPQTPESILTRLTKDYRGKEIILLAPLVVARKGIYRELAQWAADRGYPQLRADGVYHDTHQWPTLDRYKEHDIELPLARLKVDPGNHQALAEGIQQTLSLGNGVLIVAPAGKAAERLFSTRRACPGCGCGFPDLDPRLFSYNSKHGWCPQCYGTGLKLKGFDAEQTGEESLWVAGEEQEQEEKVCSTCDGQRLNATALAVRFRQHSIAQLAAMSAEKILAWLAKMRLSVAEQAIARDLLDEMHNRLQFLQTVGLHYLTLDRAAPTLSGGEAQRIRLAAQLGSNLQGVCYVLDEPTIGLHTRDNRKLLQTLRQLQERGNTVLVVEHDEDTMREADYLIDMGPGAGVNGGEVVATGSLQKVIRNKRSLTGKMLAQPLRHPLPDLRNLSMRTLWESEQLSIEGASQNNLKKLNVTLPLRRLVAITGVSGSGKSTLVRGVLYPNIKAALAQKRKKTHRWSGAENMTGWQSIDRILEVDQTPIGKTPRSCPATYIGIWDTIRKLFSGTVDARLRGYTPARFSFNAGDGRCAACGGQGMQKIGMNFLPDVRVPCDLCHGWRFNDETLTVRYKGKHIGDVLAMDIDTAADFFQPISKVHHALCLLQDVGLGYLTLGQQSPTLSGGEAQRIKLVAELSKARMTPEDIQGRGAQHNLYVLDEPTVGLHMADVDKLLRVLHRLVDAGNSVLVIEHNLDVIAEADWIIDLGPEGGNGGGKLVAQGTPATVVKRKRSHTGRYLAELLAP